VHQAEVCPTEIQTLAALRGQMTQTPLASAHRGETRRARAVARAGAPVEARVGAVVGTGDAIVVGAAAGAAVGTVGDAGRGPGPADVVIPGLAHVIAVAVVAATVVVTGPRRHTLTGSATRATVTRHQSQNASASSICLTIQERTTWRKCLAVTGP